MLLLRNGGSGARCRWASAPAAPPLRAQWKAGPTIARPRTPSPRSSGPRRALQLDLDEGELEGIRVAHVVLDPRVAIVGLADAERAAGLAGGAGRGEPARHPPPDHLAIPLPR